MSITDTIVSIAALIARSPSHSQEGARFERIALQELATIARVHGESCKACRFHGRVYGVPCLRHTLPGSQTAARAKAIGVVR